MRVYAVAFRPSLLRLVVFGSKLQAVEYILGGHQLLGQYPHRAVIVHSHFKYEPMHFLIAIWRVLEISRVHITQK